MRFCWEGWGGVFADFCWVGEDCLLFEPQIQDRGQDLPEEEEEVSADLAFLLLEGEEVSTAISGGSDSIACAVGVGGGEGSCGVDGGDGVAGAAAGIVGWSFVGEWEGDTGALLEVVGAAALRQFCPYIGLPSFVHS